MIEKWVRNSPQTHHLSGYVAVSHP